MNTNSTGVLGWDLGGAHTKAVLVTPGPSVAHVALEPCPLWRGLTELNAAAERVLSALPAVPRRHAATMTGELTDAFANRAAGVAALVSGLQRRLPHGELHIYAGRAGFLTPAVSRTRADVVASANWMASGLFAAARVTAGLFIDIGSTTTDIAPFAEGRLRAVGYRDHERLQHGELVYTGVVRTPVMALARSVPFAGSANPLMAEHFATTADVYRVLNLLPEQADTAPTADGGARTPAASAVRLARMLGRDAEWEPFDAWAGVARHLRDAQRRVLEAACRRLLADRLHGLRATLVGAGVGRFLVRELADVLGLPYVDFNTFFRVQGIHRFTAADCAPAAAVAGLLNGD